MSDMYGHRISKGKLYLRGNYLKDRKIENYALKKV